MRHRGMAELLGQLPAGAVAAAAGVHTALADLLDVRCAPLGADELRALGELWEVLLSRVSAGRLAVLAAIDGREDVVPSSRGGQAELFQRHVLGLASSQARRDARTAGLVRGDGDLRCTGEAHTTGEISRGHLDIAVRTHRELGETAREAPVSRAELASPDGAGRDDLAAALAGLAGAGDAFAAPVRQIEVIDAVLAHYARLLDVPEFDRVARRIVEALNPRTPSSAHERRFLHMSQQFDGSWVGRFECGDVQGALLKAVLAAVSGPRDGRAVDADGVERRIPDARDLGARQMDALVDLVNAALAQHGVRPPNSADPDAASPDVASPDAASPDADQPPSEPSAPDRAAGTLFDATEPPDAEGEYTVVQEPGVLSGPFPNVELVVVVGIAHLAAAVAHQLRDGLPLDLHPAEQLRHWTRQAHDPAHLGHEPDAVQRHPSGGPRPDRSDSGSPPAQPSAPAAERNGWTGQNDLPSRVRRALSPAGTPARIEHAGPVDADTLQLLACSGRMRSVVLAPDGAVLHLGRAQRLASPHQKLALLARDGGCVIPGCLVPGEACDVHHPVWWSHGGPTDLDNLMLVCPRHHTETHQGEWEIEMAGGVPWVRAPAWIDRTRPLLRNAAHQPPVPGTAQ